MLCQRDSRITPTRLEGKACPLLAEIWQQTFNENSCAQSWSLGVQVFGLMGFSDLSSSVVSFGWIKFRGWIIILTIERPDYNSICTWGSQQPNCQALDTAGTMLGDSLCYTDSSLVCQLVCLSVRCLNIWFATRVVRGTNLIQTFLRNLWIWFD